MTTDDVLAHLDGWSFAGGLVLGLLGRFAFFLFIELSTSNSGSGDEW